MKSAMLVLLLALFSGAAMGAGHELKIVGTQILCFDDGRTIER